MRSLTRSKVFPEAELYIVPDAGHSSRETGIAKKLVEVRYHHTISHHTILTRTFRQRTNSRIFSARHIVSNVRIRLNFRAENSACIILHAYAVTDLWDKETETATQRLQ